MEIDVAAHFPLSGKDQLLPIGSHVQFIDRVKFRQFDRLHDLSPVHVQDVDLVAPGGLGGKSHPFAIWKPAQVGAEVIEFLGFAGGLTGEYLLCPVHFMDASHPHAVSRPGGGKIDVAVSLGGKAGHEVEVGAILIGAGALLHRFLGHSMVVDAGIEVPFQLKAPAGFQALEIDAKDFLGCRVHIV